MKEEVGRNPQKGMYRKQVSGLSRVDKKNTNTAFLSGLELSRSKD
jgi:hypothetical protein